jgi:hypothetical protein
MSFPKVRRAAEVLALARHFLPLTRYTFTQGAEHIKINIIFHDTLSIMRNQSRPIWRIQEHKVQNSFELRS